MASTSSVSRTSASPMIQNCRIASLPNELKDTIFSYLGWELRVFLFNSRTHDSALRALWPFFCTEQYPQTSDALSSTFVQTASRLTNKTKRLIDAVHNDSTRAEKLTELTLFIPNRRLESADARPHMPLAWDGQLLRETLCRLQSLHKLSVTTFVIPRRLDSQIQWAFDHNAYIGPIQLPSSLKHLMVEEVLDAETLSEDTKAAWTRTRGFDFTDGRVEASTTLGKFCLSSIEILHVQSPALSISFWVSLIDCICLTELRYDVLQHDLEHYSSIPLEVVLERLGQKCPRLTTIDLRCAYTEFGRMQIPYQWAKLVPQVRTVRIGLCFFAQALESTDNHDHVRFELLFDCVQAVRECNDSAAKRLKEHSRTLADLDAQMDAIDSYEQEFEFRVSQLTEAIDIIGELREVFDRRRRDGLLERRSVSIVPCAWGELRVGPTWFDSMEDAADFRWTINTEIYKWQSSELDVE